MKILIVLPRFPYPLEKGDKLRAYHQIVELAKRHEIYLFCVSHERVSEESVKALEPYCRRIHVERLCKPACALNVVKNWFTSKSLQMGWWNTKRSKRACRGFAGEVKPDVVYNQMVRTMPLVARLPYRKVMDFQDALSMNTERRMDCSKGLWHYVLHYEFKMLRSSEYNAFSIFDGLTIITENDAEAIPHKKNGEIHIVPNGVDTEYFRKEALIWSGNQGAMVSDGSPLPTKYNICFVGNMSYAPNVDAARFLVNEVMPLVWKQHPHGVSVLIAGADPKPAVRALAGPNVTVSGRMDDIRTAYASADIFVAPMRIGSGMQNKLLEAMSMGLPCVTTSLAATPLGATPWEHLLVGDTAEEIADRIVKLGSEELHHSIAEGGHRFVSEHYSWATAVEPLESLFNGIVESK